MQPLTAKPVEQTLSRAGQTGDEQPEKGKWSREPESGCGIEPREPDRYPGNQQAGKQLLRIAG